MSADTKAALWVPWERVEALLTVGNLLSDTLDTAAANGSSIDIDVEMAKALTDDWDKARYKIIPQTPKP